MFHTEIHIKGKLDPNWSDWFEAMQVQVNPIWRHNSVREPAR